LISSQQSRSVKPELSKAANDLLSRLEDQRKIKPPAKEQAHEHGNDRQDKANNDRTMAILPPVPCCDMRGDNQRSFLVQDYKKTVIPVFSG
jgi:hypothetical protein